MTRSPVSIAPVLLLIMALEGAAAAQPAIDLPTGEGRDILLGVCVACHRIDEVTKFGGWYDAAQWRDVIVTMGLYGAPLQEPQLSILVDYLDEHFGRTDGR